MISTLIQNNIVNKTKSSQKKSTSQLLKESPALYKADSKEQGEKLSDQELPGKKNSRSNKITITNKSRLNAYLKSKT